jgi:predicted RecB family nuclease
MARRQLIDIHGIGPNTARLLTEAGIDSVEAVAAASIQQICAVRGFGSIRAGVLKEAARNLLAEPPVEPEIEPDKSEKARKSGKKKDKKKKKKKKGKKGNKEKKGKKKKKKKK